MRQLYFLSGLVAAAAVLAGGCSSCSSSRSVTRPDAAVDNPVGGEIPDFVLYDVGAGLGSPIFGLHVDAHGVYWFQRDGGVYRGARNGQTPASRWTNLRTLVAKIMVSDDSSVYWLEEKLVRFKNKTTGEEAEVLLPWDHTGGDLAVDEQYLYVAMWGCPSITRIDKKTLALERMDIEGVPFDERGGTTSLLLRDGGFYCGAWTNVFWIQSWKGPATKLVSSALRLWALAVLDDSVYWLNNPGSSSTRTPNVSRLVLSSGTITDFAEEPGRGASNFVLSPDAKWLFHTSDVVLHAYSTVDSVYVPALPTDLTERRLAQYGGDIATDGEALYFIGQRNGEGGRFHAVHKVPFSYLAKRVAK